MPTQFWRTMLENWDKSWLQGLLKSYRNQCSVVLVGKWNILESPVIGPYKYSQHIFMFALETDRDHSVFFEIASKYCILDSFVWASRNKLLHLWLIDLWQGANSSMGENSNLFNIPHWDNWISIYKSKRINLEPFLTHYWKINSWN